MSCQLFWKNWHPLSFCGPHTSSELNLWTYLFENWLIGQIGLTKLCCCQLRHFLLNSWFCQTQLSKPKKPIDPASNYLVARVKLCYTCLLCSCLSNMTQLSISEVCRCFIIFRPMSLAMLGVLELRSADHIACINKTRHKPTLSILSTCLPTPFYSTKTTRKLLEVDNHWLRRISLIALKYLSPWRFLRSKLIFHFCCSFFLIFSYIILTLIN